MFRYPGRALALAEMTSSPPAWPTAKKTMKMRAKVMMMLWMRSVVDTAKKPPSTV